MNCQIERDNYPFQHSVSSSFKIILSVIATDPPLSPTPFQHLTQGPLPYLSNKIMLQRLTHTKFGFPQVNYIHLLSHTYLSSGFEVIRMHALSLVMPPAKQVRIHSLPSDRVPFSIVSLAADSKVRSQDLHPFFLISVSHIDTFFNLIYSSSPSFLILM